MLPSFPNIANLGKNTLQTISKWYSVSDEQMAEILVKVRAELPTTEAWLLGKPQTGKSSLIRGLTGVSADIIGQGFRPHTQHTERYAYPNQDLPLLIFTDTVGLGDVQHSTQSIIEELVQDIQQSQATARILIVTVKINDFATDALKQILVELRQKYPGIPCLLVVTCLHEVYPQILEEHPPYPPNYPEVLRAFTAIEEDFKGLFDRTVMVDFTLEEDGYQPLFYGVEAFRDKLGELLPRAQAQAIYQLLDQDTTTQIGYIYKDVARRYILSFTIATATAAGFPLPFATMPVLTALQASMVVLLGNLYGQKLTTSQAGSLISTIAGGFAAQAVGRELVKFIPGFGSVIAASWAATYTWALGETACVYFGDLIGGKKPDPDKIQAVMNQAFNRAKEQSPIDKSTI